MKYKNQPINSLEDIIQVSTSITASPNSKFQNYKIFDHLIHLVIKLEKFAQKLNFLKNLNIELNLEELIQISACELKEDQVISRLVLQKIVSDCDDNILAENGCLQS